MSRGPGHVPGRDRDRGKGLRYKPQDPHRSPGRHIKLSVIDEGELGERPVLRPDLSYEETALIRIEHEGAPEVVMECGQCGARLVEGAEAKDLPDLVFVCNICRAYNVVPPDPGPVASESPDRSA